MEVTAGMVGFPQPADSVCEKWQLATAEGLSHMICMPHVTKQQIDALVADILATQTEEPWIQP